MDTTSQDSTAQIGSDRQQQAYQPHQQEQQRQPQASSIVTHAQPSKLFVETAAATAVGRSEAGLPNGPSALESLGSPSSDPPLSPVRFATTTDAFGLSQHNHHTPDLSAQQSARSPVTSPSSSNSARRLRRPSLLSLAPSQPTLGEKEDRISESPGLDEELDLWQMASNSSTSASQPQSSQRWGLSVSPLTALSGDIGRVGSAPPIAFEGLTTRAASNLRRRDSDPSREMGDSLSISPSTMGEGCSPTSFSFSELHRRRISRTSNDMDELPSPRLAFTGRPLPGPLLATLISESAPLEHEMRSEARYQRLISSHPSVFPLTPRPRRNTRWTRGRFPEMVGDDDDDEEDTTRQLGSRWRTGSSDTDSDEMLDDSAPEWPSANTLSGAAGAVNSAFASVMDLDRPPSSGSSGAWASASGKSTPGGGRGGLPGLQGTPGGSSSNNGAAPTPPPQWRNGAGRVAPSPASGLQLPTAFGSLAMGGSATPLGSPTVEKMELAASPSAMSIGASPGMMQYREPTSGRPGKRKAVDDRFDPYKRPRGSSPSPFQSAALSPSKPTSIPIPSSPSHVPLVGSALALGSPGYLSIGTSGRPKTGHGHAHPYTRPMSSRSRAASPALSIGSTSGVLSSSLGNGSLTGPARPLAGPFIPTGPGAAAAVSAASTPGAAPSSLGSLGFLSIGAQSLKEELEDEQDETGSMGKGMREGSGSGIDADAMEED